MIEAPVFAYRAIVFPHECFTPKGPQISDYKNILFSKSDYDGLSEPATITKFFKFISELGLNSRLKITKELNPNLSGDDLSKKAFDLYPLLNEMEVNRLRAELFPSHSSTGYDSNRLHSEIILKKNYDVLKGLNRNRRVLVQGGPGTGKTILAVKFLAENLLKHQIGMIFCANKLIKAKLENLLLIDYKMDPKSISFKVCSGPIPIDSISNEIDFLIFDEAQEYFNKGLFDLINQLEVKLSKPKLLILYDPDQSIVSNKLELDWHTDLLLNAGFTHYYFDQNYRCFQHKYIADISRFILNNESDKIITDFGHLVSTIDSEQGFIKIIREIINEQKYTIAEKIILVHKDLLSIFEELIHTIFEEHIEEINENNVNTLPGKIRYTTPIKYRGMESDAVYLFTKGLDFDNQPEANNESRKVQNYVGATRAMSHIRIIQWK